MKKKTSRIYIISSIVISIILTIFLFAYYNPKARKKRTISNIYDMAYKAWTDSCEKWHGTLNYIPGNDNLADEDTNYTYLAILIEKYRTYDYSTIRRFGCYSGGTDSTRAVEKAHDDAERDFLNRNFGEHLFEKVRQESRSLDTKYRLRFYRDFIPSLIENSYKREMLNDTMEIGILNLSGLDSIPFIVSIDSVINDDWFTFETLPDQIIFHPTKKSLEEEKIYLLPAIRINIFFNPLKTDFPYHKYAFLSILVEGKYKWEGGKYGIVKTDSVKAARNGKIN